MFDIPDKNNMIMAITQGQFNIFSALIMLQEKFGELDEVYLSTFNIKDNFIISLFKMLESQKIKKLRIMISDSISFRMPKRIELLKEKVKETKKDVILKLNWNHSKIMLVKVKDIYFCMQGSGNLSDNAQIEQYTIYNNQKIYDFHKNWMDIEFSRNKKKREQILKSGENG